MVFWQKFDKALFAAVFLTMSHSISLADDNQIKAKAKKSYFDEHFTVNIRRNNDGLEGNFKDWSIYKVEKDGKKYCYALSLPIEENGRKFKRAEPYFVVSDLVDNADEITAVSGFYYKENSDIELSFGLKKFYLFTHHARGWTYSANDDLDIIKEMQRNAEFTVTAFSQHNKIVSDRYSLIGFKQAYFKLKEICRK